MRILIKQKFAALISFHATPTLVRLSLLMTLTVGATRAHAQASLVRFAVPDSVIEQRLVNLVLKGPEVERSLHQNKIYEYQLKTAKDQWTNLLTLSANYNDQTFRQTNNTAFVYPKYLLGINIPVGTLLSRTQVKSAREGIEIGKLQQEELRRKLRADVLAKWKQYRAQAELIAMETGSMNDIEAALTETKEQFRQNKVNFEVYNTVQQARNAEQAKIINLKLQQDVIKLDLERMIGVPLETVLK